MKILKGTVIRTKGSALTIVLFGKRYLYELFDLLILGRGLLRKILSLLSLLVGMAPIGRSCKNMF